MNQPVNCDCEFHCDFEMDLLKRIVLLEKAHAVSITAGLLTDANAVMRETEALGREDRIQVLEHDLNKHEEQGVSAVVHPSKEVAHGGL